MSSSTASNFFNSSGISVATKAESANLCSQKDKDDIFDNIKDITICEKLKSFGHTKSYTIAYEHPLVMYAITKILGKYADYVREMTDISETPSTTVIETNLGETTRVYLNILANISTKNILLTLSEKEFEGMIQTVYSPNAGVYRISISARTKADISTIDKILLETLQNNNFYQGKTLRFAQGGVEFISTPSATLDSVILPIKIQNEYKLNIVDFLTNEKYHENIKKRSVLLFGPPGTGKTSTIKGLFSELKEKKVTCIWVSDDSFSRFSVEQVFSFINTYLAPALVVFEDIDLVAMDRNKGASRIIGPLLSALNGIVEQTKPIAIVATTNRVDVLDEAITRPCRFDRKLKIDFPTSEALATMFEKKLGFKPDSKIFKQFEDGKLKITGAHVEEICNTAELLGKQNNKPQEDCILEALDIIRENFFMPYNTKVGFSSTDDTVECGMSPSSSPSPSLGPAKSQEDFTKNPDFYFRK